MNFERCDEIGVCGEERGGKVTIYVDFFFFFIRVRKW